MPGAEIEAHVPHVSLSNIFKGTHSSIDLPDSVDEQFVKHLKGQSLHDQFVENILVDQIFLLRVYSI